MRRPAAALILLSVGVALLSGCARERVSERPPIHPNPDMDNQPKYKAQSEGGFFEHGAAMRTPVPGTIARGQLRSDNTYYTGRLADSSFVEQAPVEVNMQLLQRGRERYDIYCSPCHSRVGDGRGIMVNRGYVPPPTFHSERIRDMRDGQVYDIITNGVRSMPGYRYQVLPGDRWAIVKYLRVLQRSQNATINDVPVELRESVR